MKLESAIEPGVERATRVPARADGHAIADVATIASAIVDRLRHVLEEERTRATVRLAVESVVSNRIRDVLHLRLARELRGAVREFAKGTADTSAVVALFDDALIEAIDVGVQDELRTRVSGIIEGTFAPAVRTAIDESGFGDRFDRRALDELGDRIEARAEDHLRDRVRNGFRRTVGAGLAEVVRPKFAEMLQLAATEHPHDEDDSRFAHALGNRIEELAHDQVLRHVVDRFCSVAIDALQTVAGQHLRDSVRSAVSHAASRSMQQRTPSIFATREVRSDGVVASLTAAIGAAVRGRLMDGLRERIEATVNHNIDQILRERLRGAIRRAIAEQPHDHLDPDRLSEAVHYELVEVIHERICDGVRARTAEAVRTRLAEAVRDGVSHAALS